jgi:hypothetical protein
MFSLILGGLQGNTAIRRRISFASILWIIWKVLGGQFVIVLLLAQKVVPSRSPPSA